MPLDEVLDLFQAGFALLSVLDQALELAVLLCQLVDKSFIKDNHLSHLTLLLPDRFELLMPFIG